MTIASLNIENMKNNPLPLNSLLNNHTFVCLQEHWVCHYEKHCIGNIIYSTSEGKCHPISSTHDFHAKCSDEKNPHPPAYLPRGSGGVVTLWPKSLSHCIRTLPDGNERIAVVGFEPNDATGSITIINAYFPCRGTDDQPELFQDMLDQIREIYIKYSINSKVVICSDLNASITDPKYPTDRLAGRFFSSLQLIPPNLPVKHTFFHYNGARRQIDYILGDQALIVSIKIYDQDPYNTSTHVPLTAVLSTRAPIPTKQPKAKPPAGRLQWHKGDIARYKINVTTLIQFDLLPDEHPTSIETGLATLTSILQSSADDAIPRSKGSTRSNICLNPLVVQAMKDSRQAHHKYKIAMGPRDTEAAGTERKVAKRSLRSSIRTQNAIKRTDLYQDITCAHSDKDALFYRLIARQRSSTTRAMQALKIDGVLITNTEDILAAWAEHFERLATPDPKQDAHGLQMEKDLFTINNILSHRHEVPSPVSPREVAQATARLNNNKAADSTDLCAEHIKNAMPFIQPILCKLLSAILQQKYTPALFKTGTLTPCAKKNKDPLIRDHHRGIVVTPIISKVLEHVIAEREKPQAQRCQNKLQFGFTEGLSPAMAALLVTEVTAEHKDHNLPTYFATLDTRKAFDTVWHTSLFRKLFMEGHLDTFIIHTSLLQNNSVRVKVADLLSRAIMLRQGVGQGKVLSVGNYKSHLNPELNLLCKTAFGAHIGDIYCGAPTCADDMAMMANNLQDLQAQIYIAETYSNQERFDIHPDKTKVVKLGTNSANTLHPIDLMLNGVELHLSESCTHLGIQKDASCPRTASVSNNLIEARIKLGRATAYALMGAGFCGIKGLNPIITRTMMTTYVVPRMIYGLESQLLSNPQYTKLEDYHRNTLRQLQGLPRHVAKEAVYLLMGALPLRATIHLRALKLFHKIASDDDSLLFRVAQRQLAVKDTSSHSWFMHIVDLCSMYNLPSPHELLWQQPSKDAWKELITKQVTEHWETKLKESAANKSTLRYMDLDRASLSEPHIVWKAAIKNPRASDRAIIKARFLTGTYNLHGRRVHFISPEYQPNCKLCSAHIETREHMLTECPTLAEVRNIWWERVGLGGAPQIQTILDHTTRYEPSVEMEEDIQMLCYKLHCRRLKALNSLTLSTQTQPINNLASIIG